MSDTPKTPETEVVEAETVTTEVTQETQKTQENTSEKGRGSRKPRRNDRRGIREEVKEFQEEILAIDRVTRVTAGGRQLRFRVSMVIGDGKGRVGLGIGKAGEVQGAIEKALRDARKNLITFPIVDGTIAHDVTANFKSSAIFIHPAHPGTGIIAGGSARKVFAVAGLKDVIAKQHGAPNTITNTRVTLKALQSLKPSSLTRSFSKAK
ncbi:MAG: 30S ribosomal protein S5 [Candidatus Altimarinota bacterium]|jgi:ribosomal protein S5|nr:30S ribosomal protein S5 [Candidatus Gracilibacteria bacterium]